MHNISWPGWARASSWAVKGLKYVKCVQCVKWTVCIPGSFDVPGAQILSLWVTSGQWCLTFWEASLWKMTNQEEILIWTEKELSSDCLNVRPSYAALGNCALFYKKLYCAFFFNLTSISVVYFIFNYVFFQILPLPTQSKWSGIKTDTM